METLKIQPPANGKKLWRVKNRGSSQHESNTIACLQNSLKITNAAKKFSVKKPQLKRPKNKPGCPKDFVFVDLSPVKDEDNIKQLPPSPVSSVHSDDFSVDASSEVSVDTSVTNGSNSSGYDFDIAMELLTDSQYSYPQYYPQYPTQLQSPGLDAQVSEEQISNAQLAEMQAQLNMQESQIQMQMHLQTPQTPARRPFVNQYNTPVNQILKTPEVLHQRSQSADNIKPIQFKTYTPKKSKPSLQHRHTISEPVGGLDAFMSLNNQITVPLSNDWVSDMDPLSDTSSIEDSSLSTPNGIEGFEDMDYFKPEFDFECFLKL